MAGVFGEADPGVDDDPAAGHTRPLGGGHALPQLGHHLPHHVPVGRLLVHPCEVASQVHQHRGHAPSRHQPGQVRLEAETADVVHHGGPGVEGGLGYLHLGGIDGDRPRPAAQQLLDHGDHAAALLRGVDPGCASGTGRLPAHVDQIGPGLEEGEAMGDGGVTLGEETPIGEGVRCDVQHAHHPRPFPEHDLPPPEGEAEAASLDRSPWLDGRPPSFVSP